LDPDDATAVTAEQLRAVVNRLVNAGHWRRGDLLLAVGDAAGHCLSDATTMLHLRYATAAFAAEGDAQARSSVDSTPY
jgi:hypothetical protein